MGQKSVGGDVRLTAREQGMLADLAVLMRDVAERVNADTPVAGADLVDALADWVLRHRVLPRDMDRVHAKMGRGGADG